MPEEVEGGVKWVKGYMGENPIPLFHWRAVSWKSERWDIWGKNLCDVPFVLKTAPNSLPGTYAIKISLWCPICGWKQPPNPPSGTYATKIPLWCPVFWEKWDIGKKFPSYMSPVPFFHGKKEQNGTWGDDFSSICPQVPPVHTTWRRNIWNIPLQGRECVI